MAKDNRAKLLTCPVCGYTDSGTDAEALQEDIFEHIRSAHNLDPATFMGAGEVKPTNHYVEEPPAASPVANMGNSPSAAMAPPNIGDRDHGGAPGDPETEARYPL